MKLLKQHMLEILFAMASVILSLIIGKKSELLGYIVAFNGIQLTIALILLKSEMQSRIDEQKIEMAAGFDLMTADTKAQFENLDANFDRKHELYGEFAKISYPPLRDKAAATIESATEVVRRLAGGVLDDSAHRIFNQLADEIAEAKAEILAVHVVRTLADIAAWNKPPMSFYYMRIVEAVNRGVKVRRIFILFKPAVDPHTGCLKLEVKDVLQRQQADGIKVLIALEDDLRDKNCIKDLAVIDRRVAEYSSGSGDFGSNKPADRTAHFSVKRREVQRHVDLFSLLERFAKELDTWLEEHDHDPLEGIRPQSHVVN